MNETIKQLKNRQSIRDFTGETVKEEDLKVIFETAQRAPTSINAQQISLIYTRDKEKIKQIAELCGGQPQVESADVFVTIVIDFNRTSIAVENVGKEHVIEKSAEGIMVGAIDAGIMLSSLQTAAESFGYGTTAIGAVRMNPEKLIEILELPPKTYPAVGTTIGVPSKNAKNAPLKPRVPMESFVFEETYNKKAVKDGVIQYEKDMKKFRDDNNMDYLTSYCEQTATYYSSIYFNKSGKSLRSQGFEFQDEL
ncbi:MAG: nitroreductase family protein [Campylobacterales bacterium]|nr:nitroreductase family protein [Campylobacterales bacterium]